MSLKAISAYTKVSKKYILLPKVLKNISDNKQFDTGPAVLFTRLLQLLAPLARNAYCVGFPVPRRWLSTKVGLCPCRPDAGYRLPPALLLFLLLLLLHVPSRHGLPAHHGHPPGLHLSHPGQFHRGVRSAKSCCVEARFTLFSKNYGRE